MSTFTKGLSALRGDDDVGSFFITKEEVKVYLRETVSVLDNTAGDVSRWWSALPPDIALKADLRSAFGRWVHNVDAWREFLGTAIDAWLGSAGNAQRAWHIRIELNNWRKFWSAKGVKLSGPDAVTVDQSENTFGFALQKIVLGATVVAAGFVAVEALKTVRTFKRA